MREPVTRETLYEQVWARPMLQVAADYGVSSSYLARICTLLNVPRPERGYWAKLAAGKSVRRPPLAEVRPGDTRVWARDGGAWLLDPPAPQLPQAAPRRRASRSLPDLHPLLAGARPLFTKGRVTGDGYLKPSKILLPDLVVSEPALDKALALANRLYLAMEAKGYSVVIAPAGERLHRVDMDEHEVPRKTYGYDRPWSPGRCTVAYIGSLAFGMTIAELSEEAETYYHQGSYVRLYQEVPKRGRRVPEPRWTSKRDFPTGRLCLQVYSPYAGVKWVQQWRESAGHSLESRIPAIIKVMKDVTQELVARVEEARRLEALERQRWEEDLARWRREEAERRLAKARQDSRDELVRLINEWEGSRRCEAFLADAERRLDDLPEEDRRMVEQRLLMARELIGGIDALTRLRQWKTPSER